MEPLVFQAKLCIMVLGGCETQVVKSVLRRRRGLVSPHWGSPLLLHSVSSSPPQTLIEQEHFLVTNRVTNCKPVKLRRHLEDTPVSELKILDSEEKQIVRFA